MSALSIVFAILLVSCGGSNGDNATSTLTISFTNPRQVTILGYSGDSMEPFISRDGTTLFFNNLNSESLPSGADNDTNLHYATRINDVTFQYQGEVTGADTDDLAGFNELEAVASMDVNGTFYFVRTIDYLNAGSPDYLSSLFVADYANGVLTSLESLPNLKMDRPTGQNPVPGELNFDAETDVTGETLYFVEGLFSGNPFPDAADIGVASKVGGVFTVTDDSATQMAMINTDALEYAPSISTDELELYFTRATGSLSTGIDFAVYVASRSSVTEPWDNVTRIEAIAGDTIEAPSISFDGQLLYYHQRVANVFRVFVVERQ